MSVTSVTSTTAAAGATSSLATASANQLQGTQDEFLKLFMAQLQNQDPLNPQQDTDMVAQLAQFSAVEQAQQTNQQLQNLTAAQSSSSNASLSSLVGRQCQASLGDVTVDSTAALPPIQVNGFSNGASIVVTDANGKEVRRLPVPAAGGDVQWDGRDSSGKPLNGSYHIALDAGSSSTTPDAHWSGRVDSLELTANGPRLRMGGLLLAPGDISTIGQTTSTTALPATTSTTTPTATVTQGVKA